MESQLPSARTLQQSMMATSSAFDADILKLAESLMMMLLEQLLLLLWLTLSATISLVFLMWRANRDSTSIGKLNVYAQLKDQKKKKTGKKMKGFLLRGRGGEDEHFFVCFCLFIGPERQHQSKKLERHVEHL